MRNVSNAFATLVAANHTLLMKATLTLADSTVLNLTSDDFMAGTARFEQAVSSDGSFDIGGAIVGTMSVTLANQGGKFDSYDLGGATIVPYVGKLLPNNSYEWLRLGTYDVVKPDYYGGTIGITCYDVLNRLASHKYSELSVTYPLYPQALLTAIGTHCGFTVSYGTSPVNNTVSITRAPDMEMTLLDAAGYLAQMMGYWLVCDVTGNITANWYDTTAFDPGKTPYAITDSFSSMFMTEDVTITGVQVTETDEVTLDADNEEVNGRAGGTYLYGTSDYCLTIPNNPFIAYGTGLSVATGLYSRVGGMCFRPYTNSMPCDPVIEAGDAVVVTDRHGDTHNAYVTGVVLKPDGAMETRCTAKAPASNSNVSKSPLAMAVTAVKAAMERTNQVADSAKTIATATDQHFWEDTNGVHVSTEDKTPNGTRNILINSYGILLRAAAKYLAALTGSDIKFYDGVDNEAANVIAAFGSNGAQIGKINETHLAIDSNSVDVVDANGNVLFTMGADSTTAQLLSNLANASFGMRASSTNYAEQYFVKESSYSQTRTTIHRPNGSYVCTADYQGYVEDGAEAYSEITAQYTPLNGNTKTAEVRARATGANSYVNLSADTVRVDYNPFMKVVSTSAAIGNVNAGAGFSVSKTAPTQSGYAALGIVGSDQTHNQAGTIGGAYLDGTTLRGFGKNTSTSNWTGTNDFTWYVLYAKTEIL